MPKKFFFQKGNYKNFFWVIGRGLKNAGNEAKKGKTGCVVGKGCKGGFFLKGLVEGLEFCRFLVIDLKKYYGFWCFLK